MNSKYLASVQRHPRLTGGLVGFAIGVAWVLAVLLRDDGVVITSWSFEVGGVAAGTIGGFVFGRRAMRAGSDSTWVGIIFGLAGLAVVIGALVVTLPTATTMAEPTGTDLLALLAGPLRWIAIAMIGVLLLGVPALALTLPSAAVWAAVMAILAERARRASTAGDSGA